MLMQNIMSIQKFQVDAIKELLSHNYFFNECI